MGSPFVLQQKTSQAAFQDLSVQGEINSYLGRFILPSFFHAASFVLPFFIWLFLPLPPFLPCVFSCLPFPDFSAGFQWLHYHTSLPRTALGDYSSPHAYVAHLDS